MKRLFRKKLNLLPPAPPKTLEELQQEYTQACAQLGSLDVMLRIDLPEQAKALTGKIMALKRDMAVAEAKSKVVISPKEETNV